VILCLFFIVNKKLPVVLLGAFIIEENYKYMKKHTKISGVINRIYKFIDLDIKIFTDFINIVLKTAFLSLIYVPLLILGVLAFVWVVEHLKLSYVIFIFLFWLFVQFCKLCEFMDIGGPIISFTIIVSIFAAILKIKFLLVITIPILFVRWLAHDLFKEHEY